MKLSLKINEDDFQDIVQGKPFIKEKEDDSILYNLGKTKEEGAEICRQILKKKKK